MGYIWKTETPFNLPQHITKIYPENGATKGNAAMSRRFDQQKF